MTKVYTLDELKAMKNTELKKIAEQLDLPSAGSNAKLVEAIIDHQENQASYQKATDEEKSTESPSEETGMSTPVGISETKESIPPAASDTVEEAVEIPTEFKEAVQYVRVTPVSGVDLSIGNVCIPAHGIVVRSDNVAYTQLGPKTVITPSGHPDNIVAPVIPDGFRLDVATARQPYRFFLDIGNNDASWFLVGGSLPVGISLTMNGYLFGTPQASGMETFVLEVRNQAGVAQIEVEFHSEV